MLHLAIWYNNGL